MAGAICIHTSTGMKCLSSPIKDHHPGKTKCTVAEASDAMKKKVKLIETFLMEEKLHLSPAKQEVIAKVVELMLAAKVDDDTPFTIVKAK